MKAKAVSHNFLDTHPKKLFRGDDVPILQRNHPHLRTKSDFLAHSTLRPVLEERHARRRAGPVDLFSLSPNKAETPSCRRHDIDHAKVMKSTYELLHHMGDTDDEVRRFLPHRRQAAVSLAMQRGELSGRKEEETKRLRKQPPINYMNSRGVASALTFDYYQRFMKFNLSKFFCTRG